MSSTMSDYIDVLGVCARRNVFIFFDLDGVLIDAWNLIYDSYVKAGVTPPNDFHEVDGKVWMRKLYPHLTDDDVEQVYRKKNVGYVLGLLAGRYDRLPPLKLARRLHMIGCQVGVLTAAPYGTVHALKTSQPRTWSCFTPTYDSVRAYDKHRVLELIGVTLPDTTIKLYVDDQDRAAVPADWRLVRYDGPSHDLMTSIRKVITQEDTKV